MMFSLSLLALAAAASALGIILGMAHGIELERKRRPILRIVESEPEGQEDAG